ncbi:MAG: hypothetical protein EOO45_11485 [Flavobacterium sp.]|nr:MAG: hypothetical protein EOO45_11485 [Flavobacterium sp.]
MFSKLKGLTIVSLVMMAGVLWLVKLKFDKLDILRTGREILVEIVDIPVLCGNGSKIRKPHFRFKYLEKTHRKDFNGLHCEEVLNGTTIKLISNAENSVFLFEDEGSEIKSDIVAGIGLAAMFGIFAIIGQRQKDKALIPRPGNYKKEKKTTPPKMGRYGNMIE